MSNKSSAAGLFGQDGSDLFNQFSGPGLFTLAAPAPVPAVVAPAATAPLVTPTPPPPQQNVIAANQALPGQQSHSSLPNLYSHGGHTATPPPLTSSSSHLNLTQQQPPPPTTYKPRVPGSHPQPLSSLPPQVHQTPSQPSVTLPSHHQAGSLQRPTQVVQPIQQQQQQFPPQGELTAAGEPPPAMPADSAPPRQSDPNVSGDAAGRANPAASMPLPVPVCAPHWYYFEDQKKWTPFSHFDSNRLETFFRTRTPTGPKVVSTDGGRYDVSLERWQRSSVYWNETPCEVRRCTWFFKDDDKLVPYDGVVSELLEREYSGMMRSGCVNTRVNISSADYVIFHSPAVLVQYTEVVLEPGWTGEDTDSRRRPKVVRRGVPAEYQMQIPPGEAVEADHLVLVVHGIGIYSDISYRSIVECVDDFRKISSNQITAHGLASSDQLDGEAGEGKSRCAGRVEFLPIQWHACVHKERSVDQELEKLTLPSIKYMRNFVNDTLTDVLFFTSPVYCQPICDTVVGEMNRIYKLFKFRNPAYNGSVSLIGHSLGACILFDILNGQVDKKCATEEVYIHEDVGDVVDISSSSLQPGLQQPVNSANLSSPGAPLPNIAVLCQQLGLMNLLPIFQEEQIDTETIMMCSESDLKDLEIPFGPRKKLLAFIAEREYNSSGARPTPITSSSSQLGSTRGTQTPIPIGGAKAPLAQTQSEFLFEKTNNGIGQPLVNYAKLEFETSCLFCFGSPIGLFLSSRGIHSLGTSYKLPRCVEFLNIFHPHDPVAYRIEPLINAAIDIPPSLIPHHKGRKRIHLEIKENLSRAGAQIKHSIMDAVSRTWSSFSDFAKAHRNVESENAADPGENNQVVSQPLDSISSEGTLDSIEDTEASLKEKSLDYGVLNGGHRIDFVLQENPIESLNEYIFALRSHGCYWTSDDTALLVVDNIYKKGK